MSQSNQRLENVIQILKYAIKNKVSAHSASRSLGRGGSYFSDFKNEHDSNKLPSQQYKQYLKLLDEYEKLPLFGVKTKSESKDLNVDEKYDSRSTCWENRDDEGKIESYGFNIKIHGEKDFVGTISRFEMEQLVSNYPHTTQANCSTIFPRFNFIEVKRLILCFKISKNTLLSKHSLEEETEEKLVELTLRAKERSVYKKIVTDKPIFIEKELRDLQKSYLELKEDREWLKNIIQETLGDDYLTFKIEYQKQTNEKCLVIYLADLHIGACNKGSQYENNYNEKEYYSRLEKILKEISKQVTLYSNFESVKVIQLGDEIDGWCENTTRGGHKLPQNLNNREQFKSYIDSIIWFFQELHKMNVGSNLEFISVGDSNHSGDIGYIVNLSLKYIFELKFPNVIFTLFDKFIEHIFYNEHCLIISHGKDKELMFKNLPLNLDLKTENYFNDYIRVNKIKSKSKLVISADLHQYSTQVGKNFRYTKIPSVFGSSGWIQANFGYTQPAFVYQILDKYEENVVEGYLGLD